jgi:hypothetical protein
MLRCIRSGTRRCAVRIICVSESGENLGRLGTKPPDSYARNNPSQLRRRSPSNRHRQDRRYNTEVLLCPISFQRLFFLSLSRTYKIPAIVIDRGNLGLEIYTSLTLDNVMIAKTLVPRYILEDPLAVHVDPGFLEAENAARGKVDAGIIEIVAHGNLREC